MLMIHDGRKLALRRCASVTRRVAVQPRGLSVISASTPGEDAARIRTNTGDVNTDPQGGRSRAPQRLSGVAVFLLITTRDAVPSSPATSSAIWQNHQAGHDLIFMSLHKRDHAERIAQTGNHADPQQRAEPVEELESGG